MKIGEGEGGREKYARKRHKGEMSERKRERRKIKSGRNRLVTVKNFVEITVGRVQP